MKIATLYHQGVTCIRASDPLAAAARLMTAGDFGALPVYEDDRLAGIVSERDLAHALARGLDPAAASVGDCMTRGAITVDAETDSDDATALMLMLGVRHLPVTQGTRLLGMLSVRDLLPLATWPAAAGRAGEGRDDR